MAATAPSSTLTAASPVAAPRSAAAQAAAVAGSAASNAKDAKDVPVRLGVSASVGHDHWANDVLSAVADNDADREASPPAVTSAEQTQPQQPEPALDPVAAKVAEKKRKFHSGRMLELKNLPDGCTEEVGAKHLEWDQNKLVERIC